MFESIKFNFARPWFLLLIILFLAFTIIPYFTLSKKYRKTRNRITSMALHAIVSLLVVLLLSGMTIVRGTSNNSNEIILLVDVSISDEQSKNKRDDLVETIINQCKFDNFKIGIVTFGYDQEYAVELTRDYKNIYDNYKNATLPDQSATDIASALDYAKDLFSYDSAGKIVLITDGKETDDNAKSVIRSITAVGIKVDIAYIDSTYSDSDDLEIVECNLPDYHVSVNEECSITIDVYSNYANNITVKLYDNDTYSTEENVDIKAGLTTVTLKHTYLTEGLHELKFTIVDNNDLLSENNEYTTYYYLQKFNKILLLESETDQSQALYKMLTDNNDYEVTTLNVLTDDLPMTALELCAYDEVVTVNIANDDLPTEFVTALNEYVYTYGGGLFTSGGSKDGEAHAYNRLDMVGSLFQQMLPVQVINYTPPVGVIVIIDRSGSMSGTDDTGTSWLEWAKAGATSCLNALTERDYFGLMTLDSDYNTILELTPRTQEAKILAAINSETLDKATGGTVLPGALDRAGQALRALKEVDKKHIIIVTDGAVPTTQLEAYEEYARTYYETDGITISVVGVNMTRPSNADELENDSYPYDSLGTGSTYERMLRLVKIGHGTLHVADSNNRSTLVTEMREDLNAPEIKEVIYEEFYPTINSVTSSIFTGVERLNDDEHTNTLTTTLTGFYGTKVRASADLLLVGDYNVPLYAQWKYGNGTVGSFMSDLYGEYSADFISDENGKQLIFNIINNISPTESIRINDIKLSLYEDNYSNTLSIYTDLNEGEYLEGYIKFGNTMVKLNDLPEDTTNSVLRDLDAYVITNMSVDNNYSRCKFVIREAGAYEIVVYKYDKDGNQLGYNSIYKSFAYSSEFDTLEDETIDYNEKLLSLATSANGSLIEDLEDPHEIIDTFDTVVYKTIDPRMFFAILAIALFLLDIAVRKFKFRWPHEIIKKYLDNRKLVKR